ncbi:dUTP pyrophosphatase [Bosea sp. TND4EK4]|nr:dUTP pyrophosphatase [Bosea sp. TND4EK4]
MFVCATIAAAHTDSLGFLVNPGSGAGLYTAQIFYGSWHSSGLSAAEGALDLSSGGNLVGTQTFTLFSFGQPDGTLPAGLVAGQNYFVPDGNGGLTGTIAGHSIYAFQSVTFTDLAAGTYTFGYNAGSSFTANWQPSDPAINSGTFTIDANGQLGVGGTTPAVPDIDTAQASYTTDNLTAGTVTNTFDGGTLRVTAGTGSVSSDFVVGAANGTIDSNGQNVTFSGNLSGPGALTKAGAGTVVLSGTNTQNGLAIAAGTVQVSNDANLGAGGVSIGNATLAAGGSFTSAKSIVLGSGSSAIDTGANTVILNGTVSGSGTLNKQGTGILVLTGHNSQNGINIAGGTLAITSDAALGAASGLVRINESTTFRTLGAFDIAHSFFINNTRQASIDTDGHDVSISGDITGAGIVQKTGAGTLTLSGSNSQVLIEVKGGSVNVASQAAIGSQGGQILLQDNGSFNTMRDMTVSQNVYVAGSNTAFNTGSSSVVLTGAVSGSGCFIKSGSGRLDMRAASSSAGGACVNEGTLALNTSFTGDVNVAGSGTLGGNGAVFGNAVISGSLSPGNSPGQLVFGGSVTQTANSRIELDIDGRAVGAGAGYFDTVLLTGAGSVYTADGTIAPRLRGITGAATNSFNPVIGDRFAVVTAEGGVTGAFRAIEQPIDGMPENSRFDVIYSSNQVVLALTPNSYGRLLTGSGLLNGVAAASALDTVRPGAASLALDARGRFFNALAGLNRQGLANAFQQIGGEVHNDTLDAVLMGNRTTRDAIGRRLRGADDKDEAGKGLTAATRFWGETYGSFGHVGHDARALGYGYKIGSFILGLDREIGANALVGGAFAVTASRTDANALGQGDAVSYQGYGYGRFAFGRSFLNVIAGAGVDSYDIQRRVDLFNGANLLKSNGRGFSVSADVEAGHGFRLGTTSIDAIAGVAWDYVGRSGLTESGSDLVALTYGGESRNAVQGRVGLRIKDSFVLNGLQIRPYAEAYLTQELADARTDMRPGLHGVSFPTSSATAGRTGARLGTGIAVKLSRNADLFVDYRANLSAHATQQSMKAGFSVKW